MRQEPPVDPAPIARAFQDAVVDVLATKTAQAAAQHGARTVLAAGGVAANGALRRALAERVPAPVRAPPPALCTDNAAMIAAAAYYRRHEDERAAADAALAFDVFSTSGAEPFSAGAERRA